MFGVLMSSVGTLFEEASTVIGKKEIIRQEESPYSLGFFNLIWGLVFLVILVLLGRVEFGFALASLPTFIARTFLEIAQLHVTVLAIARADRSTFSFIRTITIPLLLMVDFGLGYSVGSFQALGVGIILFALILSFSNKSFDKKGAGLVLFTAINAVLTISLYKYNITHFNSVAGEQIIMHGILLCFLFSMAYFVAKENPVKMLRRGIFLGQSISFGIGSILESFAYLFAPASIIIAAKRSSAILWATLTGNHYFHEKHLLFKILMVVILASGIALLTT